MIDANGVRDDAAAMWTSRTPAVDESAGAFPGRPA
jgi:hypothetical protein